VSLNNGMRLIIFSQNSNCSMMKNVYCLFTLKCGQEIFLYFLNLIWFAAIINEKDPVEPR